MLAYLSISLIEVASYPPRSGDRGTVTWDLGPLHGEGEGGGWGGGLLIKVSYWEVPPQGPTPHPLTYHSGRKKYPFYIPSISLGSGRLEVVGTRKTGAREGETLTPRVSPSRAPVLSFSHYFQAPATQPNLPLKFMPLSHTVEPLHNGQLGDRRKRPL